MQIESAGPTAPWALRLVPPFPSVAQRILALAGRTDVSIEGVSALVRMDPSFSVELLRFANSALFSVRPEISSLAHPILLLGLDRVTSIATFVVMNRMVSTSLNIPALRKVWIHSLVTAFIAEEAAQVVRVACDTAYTAGLLHNLGTLGLMSAYPDEYARMLQVSDDYGFDLLATQRDLLDIDDCAAGAFLAQEIFRQTGDGGEPEFGHGSDSELQRTAERGLAPVQLVGANLIGVGSGVQEARDLMGVASPAGFVERLPAHGDLNRITKGGGGYWKRQRRLSAAARRSR